MIFVAEIGLNHDGNFDLCYELIKQAKLSGADIAKFQFGWRDKPGEINQIDLKRAKQLKKWCDYFEIEMMASIISNSSLYLVKKINLKRNKIASRTVTENPQLCKKIINMNKEVFCSLGFWNKKGMPFGKPNKKLRYIYCVSKYPTYPHQLKNFPKNFSEQGYYGYSDHTHGIEACLLAISRGAKFIEKHFTLNKTSQVIRDHVLSATPDEFRILTEQGRQLHKVLDSVPK